MSEASPGVVLVSCFLTKREIQKRYSKSKLKHEISFSGFLDYINRDEATNKKQMQGLEQEMIKDLSYAGYMEYMGNPEKTTALFSNDKDFVTEDEAKTFKKICDKGFENDDLLWSDIVSFDNEWLKSHGIMDEKNNLDESKIKEAIRSSMNEKIKREGKPTLVWEAAIHSNTDNIHVHIASIEVVPNKCYYNRYTKKNEQRGKAKPKTLDAMKSKIANKLIDRGREQNLINEIIRKDIVGNKKEHSLVHDKGFKSLFMDVFNELPENKRYWQYNYEKISHLRPKIDELGKMYIEKYHKDSFGKLDKLLDEEMEVASKTYGVGNRHLYEEMKENKLQDLNVRLGNAILKEMKDYSYAKEKDTRIAESVLSHGSKYQYLSEKYHKANSLDRSLRQLDYALNVEYDSWKNQRDFERLMQEIEYER